MSSNSVLENLKKELGITTISKPDYSSVDSYKKSMDVHKKTSNNKTSNNAAGETVKKTPTKTAQDMQKKKEDAIDEQTPVDSEQIKNERIKKEYAEVKEKLDEEKKNVMKEQAKGRLAQNQATVMADLTAEQRRLATRELQLRAANDAILQEEREAADAAVTAQNLQTLSQLSEAEKKKLDEYINKKLYLKSGGYVKAEMPEELVRKYGAERASELAETYWREKNAETAKKYKEAGATHADKHPLLSNVATVPINIVAGITGAAGHAADAELRTGQYQTLDPNAAGTEYQKYSNAIRGETVKNIEGEDPNGWRKAASIAYQGGMALTDSTAQAATLGGAGAALVAGSNTFSQTLSDASAVGATPEQAVAMATSAAAIEALSEKIPMDNLADAFKGSKKSGMELLKQVTINAGIEMTTEELSFAGTFFAELAILKEKSSYKQDITKGILQGLSPAEAVAQANKNVEQEALNTALVSGISGGGGHIVANVFARGGDNRGTVTEAKPGEVAQTREDLAKRYGQQEQDTETFNSEQDRETAPKSILTALENQQKDDQWSDKVAPFRAANMEAIKADPEIMQWIAERGMDGELNEVLSNVQSGKHKIVKPQTDTQPVQKTDRELVQDTVANLVRQKQAAETQTEQAPVEIQKETRQEKSTTKLHASEQPQQQQHISVQENLNQTQIERKKAENTYPTQETEKTNGKPIKDFYYHPIEVAPSTSFFGDQPMQGGKNIQFRLHDDNSVELKLEPFSGGKLFTSASLYRDFGALYDFVIDGKRISEDEALSNNGYYTFSDEVRPVVRKINNGNFIPAQKGELHLYSDLRDPIDARNQKRELSEMATAEIQTKQAPPEEQEARQATPPIQQEQTAQPSVTSIIADAVRKAQGGGNANDVNIKGTGAAEQNFTGTAAYDDLLSDDNVQPPRRNDAREIEVPKTDAEGKNVSRFMSNAMNASVTTDEFTDTIKKMVIKGEGSYDVVSDESMLQQAAAEIKADGGMTESVNKLRETAQSGKVGNTDIAKGELLYAQLVNDKSQVSQEMAADVLVSLKEMATTSGRNLHLFSLLQKLTPEGRLMTVKKTVDRYVESINEGRSGRQKVELDQRGKEGKKPASNSVKEARKTAGNDATKAANSVRYKNNKVTVEGNQSGEPFVFEYAQKVGEALAQGLERKPKSTGQLAEEYANLGAFDQESKYSDQATESIIRAAMHDIGKTVSDLAKSGKTDRATAMDQISQMITERHGLDKADADHVASVVSEQLTAMVEGRAKKIFEQKFATRPERVQKTAEQMLAEYAKLGAFDPLSEYNEKATAKIVGEQYNAKINSDLADVFVNATTQAEQEAALDAIYKDVAAQIKPTLGEQWDAWRNLAMMGNAKTHERNMGSTAAFQPFVDVKRTIAATIESAFVNKENRTKAVLGISKNDNALVQWAKGDAKSQTATEAMQQGGTGRDTAKTKIQEYRKILPGVLDTVSKKNMQLMEKEDMLFKRREYSLTLASFLKSKGYTAEQVTKGQVPGSVLAEGRQIAIQEAMKATFTDRNRFSDAAARLHVKGKDGWSKALNAVAKGAVPFTRTPANVVVRVKEYSPFEIARGFHTLATKVQTGEATIAEGIEQIASGMTGSLMYAAGAALKAGIIPGVELIGRIEDEDEYPEEAQEYSVRIGDKYYGVGWLAPAAIPLFIGANLYGSWSKKEANGEVNDAWDAVDAIMNIPADIIDPMLELSMLSSLKDLSDTFSNAETAGRGMLDAITTAAANYFTQGLPTILGQAEQATETTKTTTFINTDNPTEKTVKGIISNAAQRIPGVDAYRTQKLDQWGRPVEVEGDLIDRAKNAFLNPFTVTQAKEDPLMDEIKRLNKAQEENVSPSYIPKTISYTDKDGNLHKDYRLTEEEYQKLAQTQGQTAQEVLTKMIKTTGYKGMDDDMKVKAMQMAYDYARQKAMKETFGTNYDSSWMIGTMKETAANKIVMEVTGNSLNSAINKIKEGRKNHYSAENIASYEKELDKAYTAFVKLPPAQKTKVMESATGTTKKFLEAKAQGVTTQQFLGVTAKIDRINDPSNTQKWEVIADATMTEAGKDAMMKAFMDDYKPDAKTVDTTELKYEYARKNMDLTASEFVDAKQAYDSQKKKKDKIEAMVDAGFDEGTAKELYKLFYGSMKQTIIDLYG